MAGFSAESPHLCGRPHPRILLSAGDPHVSECLLVMYGASTIIGAGQESQRSLNHYIGARAKASTTSPSQTLPLVQERASKLLRGRRRAGMIAEPSKTAYKSVAARVDARATDSVTLIDTSGLDRPRGCGRRGVCRKACPTVGAELRDWLSRATAQKKSGSVFGC